MSQLTGTVATPNAAKYIRQLCSHWGHKLEVTQGEGTGMVRFPMGTATFAATATELNVTIDAADAADAAQLKRVVESHLDRFAFREVPLSYAWSDA